MRHSARAAALLLSLFVCISVGAQAPDSAPAASARDAAKQNQAPSHSGNDDAMLARAAKLYYSTKSAGLTGFDCTVHPDWRTLIQSSVKDSTVPESDPGVVLLKKVVVTLHARLNGGSVLDWAPPSDSTKPLDAATTNLVDQMHKATDQTIKGFMQFWTPFVDGSVVPQNAQGFDITHSNTAMTIHTKQPGAEVTEVFSNELILQRFNVVTGGNAIDLSPSYDSTDKGLLVSRFVARIGAPDAPADKTQELHVEIYYQQLEGFPIPSKLNMDVIGTGTFNFALDGCHANPNP
jgi:hypothetical protein